MHYQISYSKTAKKQIKKLPKRVQQHIVSVLERVRIRPQVHFERLVGDSAYKLRVGNYRLIADIQHDVLKILVLKAGSRGSIYK